MADVLKSMTLRGLDPQLAAKLRKVAEQEGKSVNLAAPEALRKQFGLDKLRRFTKITCSDAGTRMSSLRFKSSPIITSFFISPFFSRLA